MSEGAGAAGENFDMTKRTQTKYYDYSAIAKRPKLEFPNGKRVAVVVYLNIEHFPEDEAGTAIVPFTTSFTPDALNYGWRDYGNRVGIWRLMSILDGLNIKGTVCLNSDVTHEYPEIVEESTKRGWEFMGHGKTNTSSSFLAGKDASAQREAIRHVLNTIEAATGSRPKGWLSPFLSQGVATPDILAEEGVEYLCDFTSDDQPFKFNTHTGSLVSVPYTLEINDIPASIGAGLSAAQFGDTIIDQFDMLYEESEDSARVMPICIHGFVAGQAFRAKHVRRALQYIANHEGVWFATGGELNDWYRTTL